MKLFPQKPHCNCKLSVFSPVINSFCPSLEAWGPVLHLRLTRLLCSVVSFALQFRDVTPSSWPPPLFQIDQVQGHFHTSYTQRLHPCNELTRPASQKLMSERIHGQHKSRYTVHAQNRIIFTI